MLVLPVRNPTGPPPAPLPVITTITLPFATVGTPYSLQMAASSGSSPYTWSIVSNSPNTGSWLSISSSGLLTGTPGAVEIESLTIKVTDSLGNSSSVNFLLAVNTFTGGGGVGNFNHGDSITITGGPFNNKSGSVPTLWDHGQDGAGVLSNQWSGGVPSAATNPIANIKNRMAPFQALGSSTISGPHPYTNTFLAGCHYDGANGNLGGYDVGPWLSYTLSTLPLYSYWSFYFRHDPKWWFAITADLGNFTGTTNTLTNTITGVSSLVGIRVGSTLAGTGIAVQYNTKVTAIDPVAGTITMDANGTVSGTNTLTFFNAGSDNNLKMFDWSDASDPYGPHNWYDAMGLNVTVGQLNYVHPNSNTDGPGKYGLNPSPNIYPAGALQSPDQNGNSLNSQANGLNPTNASAGVAGSGWIKGEIIARWDTATTGYFKYFENNTYVSGAPFVNYAGRTVFAGSTTVSEVIGGYARNYGAVPADTVNFASTGAIGTYTNWRYYADIYCDRQLTGTGRFMMTNSATYVVGDGNIAEIQPYTAWSSDPVVLKVNKGNLSAGTARIWFVDEANGVTTPVLKRTITLN